MKKIFVLFLFLLLPSVASATPFVKDSFDATLSTATSTFSGNVSVTGNTSFNLSNGLLALVSGILKPVIVQSPLSFSGNTLSVGAPGSNHQVLFNDSGSIAGDPNFTWDSSGKTLRLGTSTLLQIDDEYIQLGVDNTSYLSSNGIVMTGKFSPVADSITVSQPPPGFPGVSLLLQGGVSEGSQNAGDLQLYGGYAGGSGNGGNVILRAGVSASGGSIGRIFLQNAVNGINTELNIEGLSADNILTIPNTSGKLGLLEANQTWSGTNTFSKAATGTSTVNFGTIGSSTSHACFNTKNTVGSDISFYFVGTNMVVESNTCK